MRDLTTKINDSAPSASGYLQAEEFNSSQNELENAVTKGGLSLDASGGPDSSSTMLAESMTRHASGALFVTDSGAANAYVVAMAGPFHPPSALFAGLTVRFKPGNANTTAATCNAFSLGAKPIVDYTQAPLASGAIDARFLELIYRPDIGSGSWQLPRWADARYVGQVPDSPGTITSGEGWSVNGLDQGDLNFPGLSGDATPLAADQFAFYDVVDTAHKAVTFAQMSALLGVGGGLKGMKVITTSSTYTKTAGTVKAFVIVTGGGGGGGGGLGNYEGGGGGAGGTAIDLVNLSAISTVACTIGAGGNGGAAGATGSSGGSTSFATHATGLGGKPGIGGNKDRAPGGPGGSASVGLLRLAGGPGNNADPGANYGGHGGGSFWGGGGRAGSSFSADGPVDGGSGGAPGAGGGGADGTSSNNQAGNGTGGAGAPGVIFILEFA